jgi:hypothetical protein
MSRNKPAVRIGDRRLIPWFSRKPPPQSDRGLTLLSYVQKLVTA